MPLESIHKNAFKAAQAAGCAGEQGKFWEMHDRLFENQKALEPWTPSSIPRSLSYMAVVPTSFGSRLSFPGSTRP